MADTFDHQEFCSNFRERKIIQITLEKRDLYPSNETIEDFTRQLPLKSITYKREFLVKVNNGNNHYGFDLEDFGVRQNR